MPQNLNYSHEYTVQTMKAVWIGVAFGFLISCLVFRDGSVYLTLMEVRDIARGTKYVAYPSVHSDHICDFLRPSTPQDSHVMISGLFLFSLHRPVSWSPCPFSIGQCAVALTRYEFDQYISLTLLWAQSFSPPYPHPFSDKISCEIASSRMVPFCFMILSPTSPL